ncbi:MAG: hypothetical protein K2Y40_18395 [Reyranella sp.]|jgi:hypothetical protein|nr:hypothetical protein [Reyranella sp.]
MKKFLVAAALALSVAACAQGGGGSTWMQAYGPTFPGPKEGEAAVYLLRGEPGQDASPINVTVDRRELGGLAALTWMRLDLLPDLYDLRAFGPQANTELIITVTAGQSRFLLVEPKAPGGAQFVEISQAEGRRLVRKGQPVTSGR